MLDSTLEVAELTKSFKGAKTPAVDGVSFAIAKGAVFGLLGPNGAGKTTTISMMCGLFPPSSGSILLDGAELQDNLPKLKAVLGVVPQDIALYPTLTGRENLEFYGAMYKVEKSILKSRIEHWLEKLDMTESADKRVESYSGGMKRRINLIAGILHNPKILFLDEPTVGVDVQSRADIMVHLKELNESGMTIIYTSHHMEEAEKFCTDVAIMNAGKIVVRGKPSELIADHVDCTDLEDVFLHLTQKVKTQ